MADEQTETSQRDETITDKTLKKFMIVVTHMVITLGTGAYIWRLFKDSSPEVLAKFDGMIFFWYAVATLLLIFPTTAIDAIKAIKSKS